jgi:quercetin 2,3-dioxygenase
MVGAWCFVDFYGPDEVADGVGMLVPPHPHCGLQTVTWLLAGEVLHRDSVGSVQLISPGQLNLMTAGRGIAHAETSALDRSPTLHGVQLWVALPAAELDRPPSFEHYETLPTWSSAGVVATVLLGELAGVRSPATALTPLVGVELDLAEDSRCAVPVRDDWEYAALVTDGTVTVDGHVMSRAEMSYLGCGRDVLQLASTTGGRALLLGGEPFADEIVMWWNFVARSHADIVRAREEWMSGTRFGVVTAYDGKPLPAPPIPRLTLKPRGRR